MAGITRPGIPLVGGIATLSRRLAVNAGALTTTGQAALDLATTFNGSGQTLTALRVNATDTASGSGSMLADFQVGGASRFRVDKAGQVFAGSGGVALTNFGLSLGGDGLMVMFGASAATRLQRGAADHILELRNGANAQALNVYNTFTDPSIYERGFLRWTANTLELGTEFAGTGITRGLRVRTGGVTRLTIDGAGLSRFDFAVDVRGSVYVSGFAELIGVAGGSLLIREFATSSFALLQLGGSTSAFPAFKRSAATLQARLADDSGFADFQARNIIENPVASLALAANGQHGVEATNNTTLTLKLRGSDGVTRSVALTLA
jgi:hypothetical protein